MILTELQNPAGCDFSPWVFLHPSRFLAVGIYHVHEKLNTVRGSVAISLASLNPRSQVEPPGVSLLVVEKAAEELKRIKKKEEELKLFIFWLWNCCSGLHPAFR